MKRGIPTTYRGARCRSRLEATWLAFADLLGIEWRHESHDAQSYIPDLLLADSLLCEIRPLSWYVYDDTEIVRARDQVSAAAAQLGYGACVLGLGPDACEEYAAGDWIRIAPRWAPDVLRGDCFAQLGTAHGIRPLRHQRLKTHDMQQLWREAQGRVQWKPNQHRSMGAR